MKRTLLLIAALGVLCMNVSLVSVHAQTEVIIGVPTALTALEGREALKAVELAVEEINAKGGITVGSEKKKIKIESIDLRDASPGVPVSEALLGIEKIITETKVNAIVVGPFRSEALLAAMDLISEKKVPNLNTIAMSPKFEEKIKNDPEKYKYCFRVCLNSPFLVGHIVNTLEYFKKEYGFNKVFAMHQDVLWAKATSEGVLKVAAGKGWENLGTEVYPTGASDFSAALIKAKTKGAQIIIPVFDMPQSGILIKQWQAMKIPAMLAGFISPMAGPGSWKIFEGKLEGLLNTTFELGSAIGSQKYAPAQQFNDAYAKKFGIPMEAGHGPAPSYESVYILAEAIERAGSLDPDKITAEIKNTDRKGVIGRIKFNDGNQAIYGEDPSETAVGCVFQWGEGGKRTIVFPPALAEGPVKLPEWVKSAK